MTSLGELELQARWAEGSKIHAKRKQESALDICSSEAFIVLSSKCMGMCPPVWALLIEGLPEPAKPSSAELGV